MSTGSERRKQCGAGRDKQGSGPVLPHLDNGEDSERRTTWRPPQSVLVSDVARDDLELPRYVCFLSLCPFNKGRAV